MNEPERDLIATIILRAIDDLGSGGRKASAARAWFEAASTKPGSFSWYAEFLGIPADSARRRILERAPKEDKGV